MAKEEKKKVPLPPSVDKVFANFFDRLEKEPDFSKDALAQLKVVLTDKQAFDPDSIGDALKLPAEQSK